MDFRDRDIVKLGECKRFVCNLFKNNSKQFEKISLFVDIDPHNTLCL